MSDTEEAYDIGDQRLAASVVESLYRVPNGKHGDGVHDTDSMWPMEAATQSIWNQRGVRREVTSPWLMSSAKSRTTSANQSINNWCGSIVPLPRGADHCQASTHECRSNASSGNARGLSLQTTHAPLIRPESLLSESLTPSPTSPQDSEVQRLTMELDAAKVTIARMEAEMSELLAGQHIGDDGLGPAFATLSLSDGAWKESGKAGQVGVEHRACPPPSEVAVRSVWQSEAPSTSRGLEPHSPDTTTNLWSPSESVMNHFVPRGIQTEQAWARAGTSVASTTSGVTDEVPPSSPYTYPLRNMLIPDVLLYS